MCTTVCGSRNVLNNVSTSRWLSLIQLPSTTPTESYSMWYIWRKFLIIKVKHLNTCVPSQWEYQGEINLNISQLLQTLRLRATAHFVVSVDSEAGREEQWQLRRNGVPLMNNLSVYFWVTQRGLNQGVAVMFFHKRRLSGGASHRRTAVPAVCPVELSPCPQPEARRRVRDGVIISIWHTGGNYLSWPLIYWRFKCLNSYD